MSSQEPNSVVRYLRKLIDVAVSDRSDAELLQAFLAVRDEKAFETIVDRHGPLVRGVCMRILGNTADADDAFQATFLVLVRNARSIRRHNSIAPWLHGVARRIAHKSRVNTVRRHAREQATTAPAAVAPSDDDMTWRELMGVVDEEIAALPEKYAAPLILCCLQGKTRDEAAQELGCTVGSIKKRLELGRELLRSRLVRRGLTLPATFFALTMLPGTAGAAISPSLLLPTVDAACKIAAGQALSEVAAPSVGALVNDFGQAMFLAKLKLTAAMVLLALGVSAGGVGTATYVTASQQGDAEVALTDPIVSTPVFSAVTPPRLLAMPVEEDSDGPPPVLEDKSLRDKLEALEAEAGKVRQDMLREIEAEQQRVAEELKKAQEEHDQAAKAGDKGKASRALQAIVMARSSTTSLNGMHVDIQRRFRVGEAAAASFEEDRLGIRFHVPSSTVAQQMGLSPGQGVVINRVTPASPAGKAGLQADDILLQVNGQSVPSDFTKFRKLLADLEPGAGIDVLVLRQGTRQTIQGITLPATSPASRP